MTTSAQTYTPPEAQQRKPIHDMGFPWELCFLANERRYRSYSTQHYSQMARVKYQIRKHERVLEKIQEEIKERAKEGESLLISEKNVKELSVLFDLWGANDY